MIIHSKTKEIVVFAGYRDWADELFSRVSHECPEKLFIRAASPDELSLLIDRIQPDCVVLAGWSWILPEEIVNSTLVVGLHPSDLPDYAGGSPIQHQIIDGVTSSKMTLFRVTSSLDSGPALSKVELSLCGHMEDIFERMVECGVRLLVPVFQDLKKIAAMPVETLYCVEEVKNKRRLKPEASRLKRSDFQTLTTLELFNLIRAREDPYPNVYIEDETGKLFFTRAEFEEK